LWSHFWPHIRRGTTAGLPQWYKDELAKAAFTPGPLTVADIADPRPVERGLGAAAGDLTP